MKMKGIVPIRVLKIANDSRTSKVFRVDSACNQKAGSGFFSNQVHLNQIDELSLYGKINMVDRKIEMENLHILFVFYPHKKVVDQ